MNHLILTFIVVFPLLSGMASAGEYNPTVDIGEKLTEWKDLPGVDGKAHSLSDDAQFEVLIVFFTSHGCPYSVDYQQRISELAKKYEKVDEVQIVGINSNAVEEDSLEAMKERAAELGWKFPYLKDENAELAKAWGATRTPEFFVLNSKREVVYMGAMDDDADADKANKHYVQQAIEATLSGEQPEVQETVPIGCSIRFPKRSRRK